MRLSHYVAVLLVLVAVALLTTYEHLRAARAGYRLYALEIERERLTEQRRRLEVKRMREERLERLEERALSLGLVLEEPLTRIEH